MGLDFIEKEMWRAWRWGVATGVGISCAVAGIAGLIYAWCL